MSPISTPKLYANSPNKKHTYLCYNAMKKYYCNKLAYVTAHLFSIPHISPVIIEHQQLHVPSPWSKFDLTDPSLMGRYGPASIGGRPAV